MMRARIASVFWTNVVFKCRDAVLTKIKISMAFEIKMELRNAPIIGSTELLPSKMVSKAKEKLSRFLRVEAIKEMVLFDKRPSIATEEEATYPPGFETLVIFQ